MKKKSFILMPLLLACILFMPRTYAQTAQELQVKADAGDAAAQVKLGIYYQNGCHGVAIDSVRAMQLFQKAANQGNNDAKVYLSDYYIFSRIVPHDTIKCYTLCKEAADANCPYGLFALGVCYEYGYGVSEDTTKAVQLYEQAYKMKDGHAAYTLSVAYEYGDLNLQKDMKKGFELSKKSFQWGCYKACQLLATYYAQDKKFKEAWEVINKGLEMNDVDTRIQAANFYALGVGTTRDERKALAIYNDVLLQRPNKGWAAERASGVYITANDLSLRDTLAAIQLLEKVIANGCVGANYPLGKIYYYVNGQYNDHGKALQCFLKSLNDVTESYHMAGWMYILGDGTERDTQKGLALLQEGYNKKSADCAGVLGAIYSGIASLNIQTDYPRALNYLKKAVEWRGDEIDYETLYDFYRSQNDSVNALKVTKDAINAGIAKGYFWMSQTLNEFGETKAAIKALNKGLKAGDESSGLSLAKCYAQGYGLKQDYKKAAEICKQLGTPHAIYNYAMYIVDGKITNQTSTDLQTVITLLQQSANGGYSDALYALGNIYKDEEYGVQNIDVALGYFRRMAEEGDPEGYFQIGAYYEEGGSKGTVIDSAKCSEYYQKAADCNHAKAMCYLADFYRVGRMLPVDSAKALELYSKPVALDNAHAYERMALCYLQGIGVPVDSVKAVSYLRIAAAKGDASADAYLGNFYNNGCASLEMNGDSALYYYFEGSKLDKLMCDYKIGLYLFQQGLYDKAFSYFYSAATNGNVEAIIAVAQCLQEGTGVETDPQQAYQLYQYAAHQFDNSDAYLKLGVAHISGNGCSQDYALAKSYFVPAAATGNYNALYNLGICYRDGIGCTSDSVIALQWFLQSVEAGSVRAINELGDMYESGEGVPQDFNKAAEYYQMGVDKYHSLTSMCNLGYCYEKGQGVILNSPKAFELYKQAAQEGSARGMFMLASCYIEGVSVPENPAKAEEWLLKSAEQGYVLACYYLGIMYEKGEDGVAADKKKAIQYYTMAAEAGYEPAQAALAKMKKR